MISSPFPHHAIASLRQVGMMGLTPLPLRIRNGKIRSFTSLQMVHTHTTLSHTIFHTQLCHTPSSTTPSFTHNFVTHHLSHTTLHTQLCHTPSFTHNFAHTTLSHTIFHHTIFHTQLCTHHLSPHHLSHTTLSQLCTHTHTLCHTPSFTSLCLAGVALGDIHHHFVWQAWHLVTSTFVSRSRCGTYGTGLALVAQLCHNFARAHTHTHNFVTHHLSHHFAWQAWRLLTSTFALRGRHGTW